jgi:hypothetical protein
MTFLNATLIFGLAATAVPIVLHLLARREPRKVVFPSVRFLTKRFESNRSRLQVRRWWLLALRIAALAALALALARPAIHRSLSLTWLTIGMVAALGIALLVMATVALSKGQSRTTTYALGGAATVALLAAMIWGTYTYASGPTIVIDSIEPVSIAIVLDNSTTSAWKTASDDRIARMQDLATWMTTRLPPTSRIAIIDRSAQPAAFSLDVATAMAKIEQLRPLQVTQPIASRLDAAARLVRTSDLPNRQVLLVTDLAVSTWNEATSEASLSTVFGEDPAVALTVFDLGDFDGINRSLSIPRFADLTPPRGVPVAVSTTLQLAANEETSTLSVTAELEIYENDPGLPVVRDGVIQRPQPRSVDRTSVRVAPGGSSDLLLTIPAMEIGTHHGQIRLVGDDAIQLDDTRYFTLQVLSPSQLLLVSNDEDEARIISQAITASPGMIDEADAEFLIQRIEYADLPVVRLEDFVVLIMLDPPRDALSDEAVTKFASRGGGVLVCLGPTAAVPTAAVQTTAVQTTAVQTTVVPTAAVTGTVTAGEKIESTFLPNLVRRWRSPDPGTFFQVLNASHPVTQSVSTNTPWSDFRVHQYWQLTPDENDSVLIQYAGTTHAAMVERVLREDGAPEPGHVLVITTPLPALAQPARSWNDLFGTDPWPAWLLTRQSIEYLSRRGGAELTSLVGQPQVIRLDGTTDPDENKPQRIQLFTPGASSPVPLNVPVDAKQVIATDISRAGTYWLRGAALGAGFSANVPSEAIGLGRIDSGQLDQIFGPGQYSFATNREEIEFAESKATSRVSLHSPAMLLAILVFVLEQILGNRFYRARPAAA